MLKPVKLNEADEGNLRGALAHELCKRIAEHANRTYDREAESVVTAQADDDFTEVRVTGVFDGGYWGGVSAKRVIEAMGDSKKIRMIIDSPGGLVDVGNALYGEMRKRIDDGAEIITEGNGLVASAAIMPFMAADVRSLREATMLMIHNVSSGGCLFGDADFWEKESKKEISALKAYQNNLADVLSRRLGKGRKEIDGKLDAESWYSVDEAKAYGFTAEAGSAKNQAQAGASAAVRSIADSILNTISA